MTESAFTSPVLAFDTSLNGCVAALLAPSEDRILAVRELETEREQAALLVPLIQDAMKEAGVAFAELGLIATTRGPGSFTGLRIGLSTARSFGLALNIPVYGIGSLAAMAASCREDSKGRPLCVLLETKRQDFYAQMFSADLSPLSDPLCAGAEAVAAHDGFADMCLCGDAVGRFEAITGITPEVSVHRHLHDPAILARQGLAEWLARARPTETPAPLYLKGADVSVSNKTARKIQDISF